MINNSSKNSFKMNSEIEKCILDRKHSLGNNPAFPQTDTTNFEVPLITSEYEAIVGDVKRIYDTEDL